jgi:hypothetical protein
MFFCSMVVFGFNQPTDIDRIMKSGNGQSIKTAYKVNSIAEEYNVLRYLKLKPVFQKTHIKEGVFYDEITTKSGIIYFKVIAKKLIPKNLPQVI